MPSDEKKVGRPKGSGSKLKTIDLAIVEKYVAAGLTDRQLALILGVNESTIYRWKSHDEFVQAIKRGQQHANAIVERSLFQRAVGYTAEEHIY